MEADMHDYVLLKLAETKGKWPEVAVGSGVAYRTLQKVATEEIGDPGVSIIQRLHDYFRQQERAAA